ncbi:LexA family transcriptional regulator [Flavobacterium terrisoli]|uniref:LexA family transcriptional regulator n=1 Tax=Flavobacterium terrisoli TaxID=3242195 RepID=UPI0025436DFB|nr:helix-turn-helix domain-containing protein [Flavobacterium buctense]
MQKLKFALKIRTDIELSEFLNVKPNTISSWKKRDTLDYSSIIAICELYEIDLNDIFYNKTNSKGFESVEDGTYLVSRESQYQYCVDNKGILETLPKYTFPFLRGDASRAFQAISNNMFPVIEERSYVLCTETDINQVKDNDLIVIVSQKKGIFINRLKILTEEGNSILLKNDHPSHHDLVFDKADIDEIWLIKGVVSYDINSNNKMKFLNDNLKIMDTVLSKIS